MLDVRRHCFLTFFVHVSRSPSKRRRQNDQLANVAHVVVGFDCISRSHAVVPGDSVVC